MYKAGGEIVVSLQFVAVWRATKLSFDAAACYSEFLPVVALLQWHSMALPLCNASPDFLQPAVAGRDLPQLSEAAFLELRSALSALPRE